MVYNDIYKYIIKYNMKYSNSPLFYRTPPIHPGTTTSPSSVLLFR